MMWKEVNGVLIWVQPTFDPATGRRIEEGSEHLDHLRQTVAGESPRPKVVCGDAFSKGKTPQELHQEEMEFLHRGGSDPSGREAMERAMRRAGR